VRPIQYSEAEKQAADKEANVAHERVKMQNASKQAKVDSANAALPNPLQFKVGDFVMVKNHRVRQMARSKIDRDLWLGPCKVLLKKSATNYVVKQIPAGYTGTVNVCNMKQFKGDLPASAQPSKTTTTTASSPKISSTPSSKPVKISNMSPEQLYSTLSKSQKPSPVQQAPTANLNTSTIPSTTTTTTTIAPQHVIQAPLTTTVSTSTTTQPLMNAASSKPAAKAQSSTLKSAPLSASSKSIPAPPHQIQGPSTTTLDPNSSSTIQSPHSTNSALNMSQSSLSTTKVPSKGPASSDAVVSRYGRVVQRKEPFDPSS
jgi:hypothetical protein